MMSSILQHCRRTTVARSVSVSRAMHRLTRSSSSTCTTTHQVPTTSSNVNTVANKATVTASLWSRTSSVSSSASQPMLLIRAFSIARTSLVQSHRQRSLSSVSHNRLVTPYSELLPRQQLRYAGFWSTFKEKMKVSTQTTINNMRLANVLIGLVSS
jgi:hypothetical protein